MAKRSVFTKFLVTATSFAGGVALGMLLAPKSGKENREWINRHTSELTDWMDDQSREVINRSNRHLAEARKRVQQGIRNNVPDLYDATEEIRLDESPIIGV